MEKLKKYIREVADFPKPGILFYDISTLLKNPKALRMTVDSFVWLFSEQSVDKVNRSLAGELELAGSQIQRFLILHKELDADDGELTRTQKVRRGFIADRYGPLVKALYDGSNRFEITTEVTFEDGRKGEIKGDVKIVDMTPYPAQHSKEAAE